MSAKDLPSDPQEAIKVLVEWIYDDFRKKPHCEKVITALKGPLNDGNNAILAAGIKAHFESEGYSVKIAENDGWTNVTTSPPTSRKER